MNAPIRVGVVGLGKIAHDQHLPAIERSSDFQLVAAASPAGAAPDVPNFPSIEAMLASGIDMDAVAMCQPPQYRFDAALRAIRSGKHVLLEKPPGCATREVDHLASLANDHGTTLFAAWHSRFAPAVAPARTWLAARRILSVSIEWREDVKVWHPGQTWIWQPGGFGVFDPGINALSILTRLMPEGLRVQEGTLQIPRDAFAPVSAQLTLRSVSDVPVSAVFDFRQRGAEIWSIHFETDGGTLTLQRGGAALQVAGEPQPLEQSDEYAQVYREFAALVRARRCEVDTAPLRLVADAFTYCRVEVTDPLT